MSAATLVTTATTNNQGKGSNTFIVASRSRTNHMYCARCFTKKSKKINAEFIHKGRSLCTDCLSSQVSKKKQKVAEPTPITVADHTRNNRVRK